LRAETYFDKLISESEIRIFILVINKYMKIEKTSLVGQSLEDLIKICESYDVKSYRAKQIFNWVYKNKVSDFKTIKNMPNDFITSLKKEYKIHSLNFVRLTQSNSELTNKFLFKTQNGSLIESVLMKEGKRVTLCLSTQVGCALDCKFCATAKMGFIENLNPGEILDQFLLISKNLKSPITNIVFMGMGEPFLNYANVIKAANLLHDPNGINLGYKRITISTAGIVKRIEQFSKEGQKFKLAISLNGTTNDQRLSIMPVTKKNSLKNLLSASKKYTENSNTWLTFEYVLIKDCNDTIEDAERLIKILTEIKKCKINIIPYNTTDGTFQRPNDSKIKAFMNKLNHAPFPVTIRWSKGTGIDAGCGQLVTSENLISA